MPIDYCYDEKVNVLTATARGTLKVEEFEEYLKSVMNNPGVRPGFLEIFVYADVEDFDFRYKCGKLISNNYSKLLSVKKVCASIHYSPDHLHMGISYLVPALLENILDIKIVKSRGELQYWIDSFR